MLRERSLRIEGAVYKDRKTKRLIQRLPPGGIAVLEHPDVDLLAAEDLIQRRVAAVVNTRPFLSGRYPSQGASRLLDAGVPLLEVRDPHFWNHIHEGERVEIDLLSGSIRRDGKRLATAQRLTPAIVQARLQQARRNLEHELDRFLDNTIRYARREKHLLCGSIRTPPLKTPLSGRHVLVVVRGQGYREDLRAITHYIRDFRPVLIGVDGGADALCELGYAPDIVIGDMDSVSDEALRRAGERVVHAYPRGQAPGLQRVRSLGLSATIFPVAGTSEDAALLLAYEGGARLIVAVGTHTHVVDFLEKGRAGMASTLLVRWKVGSRLVDAKGVSMLYRRVPVGRYIAQLVTAALLVVTTTVLTAPMTRGLLQLALLELRLRFGL